MGLFDDDFDDESHDDCMDETCRCECHDDEYAEMGLRIENGVVMFEDKDGPPYVRKGVFPFLQLPGEIREKIYGYAFLQAGARRKSPNAYHRGTIHTAILGTCRQIYKEASHLPLSLNTLNFSSAIYTLDFLGFSLAPTQKALMTSIHVEFYFQEFPTTSWQLLLKQLAKMPITHLGLTIKGGYSKEAFLGHKCFANRFASAMKGIKSFDVILASGMFSKKIKEDIQEEIREILIKGYKRPNEPKSKTKRNSTSEPDGSKKPTKKVKKPLVSSTFISRASIYKDDYLTSRQTKHQVKLVHSPKSGRLGMKSQKPERQVAEAARNRARQALLTQYDQLKQYAISMDHDAAPVRFRLEDARQTAEALDESKFENLAHDIIITLEERFDKIATARNSVQKFTNRPRILTPPPPTSQDLIDPLTSPSSSQLSM